MAFKVEIEGCAEILRSIVYKKADSFLSTMLWIKEGFVYYINYEDLGTRCEFNNWEAHDLMRELKDIGIPDDSITIIWY